MLLFFVVKGNVYWFIILFIIELDIVFFIVDQYWNIVYLVKCVINNYMVGDIKVGKVILNIGDFGCWNLMKYI